MAQSENPVRTQDSGGDQNTVVPPKNSSLKTPLPANEGSTGGQEKQEGTGKSSPSLTTPTGKP